MPSRERSRGIGLGAFAGTLIWAFSKRSKARRGEERRGEERRAVGLSFGGQPLAQGCPKRREEEMRKDKKGIEGNRREGKGRRIGRV
jgi:hypothetical protein